MWYLAFGAGVYGYLFPGNINTMLMSLYQHRRFLLLSGVIVLALIFEYIYCFVALNSYAAIGNNNTVALFLNYGGCILGLFFGCWILFERAESKQRKINTIVARGIVSIVVHPQQVTFWLYIYALLQPFGGIKAVSGFAFFNIIGCAVIFIAYMRFGNAIIRSLQINEVALQRFIGFMYIFSSIVTVIRTIF